MKQGPRVLVAEDNDLNYELVEFILTSMGLVVSRAARGDQVLDIVAADPPDLILMDVQLPGIDGLELTRHLKADDQTSSIPIVALTALAMVGDGERVLQAGCDGYLTKPVASTDLRNVARRFLPKLAKNQ